MVQYDKAAELLECRRDDGRDEDEVCTSTHPESNYIVNKVRTRETAWRQLLTQGKRQRQQEKKQQQEQQKAPFLHCHCVNIQK